MKLIEPRRKFEYKYKNRKGLNELKSNQGSMNINIEDIPDEFEEKRFEVNDQEEVESHAGEQGMTSGDSFDKHPQS